MAKKQGSRIETDKDGSVEIPASAYWGASTFRATDGLAVSGTLINRHVICSFITVCKCSALSLREAGLLDHNIAQAISQAADEVLSGMLNDQFIVDALQPDVARALAWNVGEVLANRASEMLSGRVGAYELVSAERHVLLGLEIEDILSCSLRMAVLRALSELEPALLDTERLLRRKALELDAKVFNSYGAAVQRAHARLTEISGSLLELNLLRLSDSHYPSALAARTIERVSAVTAQKFRFADEYIGGGNNSADFVGLSGCLRELVLVIARIASDLRMKCELHTIADTVIAGSYQICGCDNTVVMCAQDSSMPAQMLANMAYSLLQSIEIACRCTRLFNRQLLGALRVQRQSAPQCNVGIVSAGC